MASPRSMSIPRAMQATFDAVAASTYPGEVNGMLVDLRDMPREVQVIACEKGLIPNLPADRE